MFDWSLWVRRVDVALIGGDPLTLARRVSALLEETHARPLRLAILHPTTYSGAPLAALEDGLVRRSLGLEVSSEFPAHEAPKALIHREVRKAASLLEVRSGGGVMAFEMTQGLWDRERKEAVLRLTRKEGRARRSGPQPSSPRVLQISQTSEQGPGANLYQKSEDLHRWGLREMHARFKTSLAEPPEGHRFADLIIAKRCELLSGFISPPSHRCDGLSAEELSQIVGRPYRLAGFPPRAVREAMSFWAEDFARASNNPMSSGAKELDI